MPAGLRSTLVRRCALIVLFLLPLAVRAGEDRLAVDARPAFHTLHRPGSPVPIKLVFRNSGRDRSGRLTIIAGAVRYRSNTDLPAPTTREILIRPVFSDQAPAMDICIERDGAVLFQETIRQNLRAVADDADLGSRLQDRRCQRGTAPAGKDGVGAAGQADLGRLVQFAMRLGDHLAQCIQGREVFLREDRLGPLGGHQQGYSGSLCLGHCGHTLISLLPLRDISALASVLMISSVCASGTGSLPVRTIFAKAIIMRL